MRVCWIVRIPSIPGIEPLHKDKRTAEREQKNAAKAGHPATIEEVLLRVA